MMIDQPELALQNRQDMIKKKFNLITYNRPDLTSIYLRNLFKRHPDLFLKSYASMEAKVNYFKRNLNRQLQAEKAFPLLLHYNFTQHIWPRCEVLRDVGVKNFDMVQALATSDEDFCQIFDIKQSVLNKKKKQKAYIEEKDELWVYATGN